ncbi:MAG: ABC transporter permease, partial [Saprospiraceae bacterium]|nr:ABC transporter permease [Saprospiraceae bacterium]
MLQNYFKLALRNLTRNSLYSLLNISGLAIGVAACLLILLFVAHEMSYDRWNPQADRIMRPTYEIRVGGFDENHSAVDATVGPEAAAALPEIAAWCRIRQAGTWDTRLEGQAEEQAKAEKVLLADSSFFMVFPLKILAGDATHGLNQPGGLAISRSRAEHNFSSAEQAIGQTLVVGRSNEHRQVTAVFEDMPDQAHFHADLLFSLAGNAEIQKAPPYWGYNNNYFTYFLLKNARDKATFTRKFDALAANKISILLKDLFATTTAEFEKTGQRSHFELQNLTDIHLYSNKQSELEANG